MDQPLRRLAEAAGISVDEWPEHVDEDIAEFTASTEPRALFVVEQADGLVIGPPPKLGNNARCVVIAKPAAALSGDWTSQIVAVALPLNNDTTFKNLHAIVSQVLLPVFDSQPSESAESARHRLVEAERALAALLRHTQVAFIDLTGGETQAAISKALDGHDLNALQNVVNTWKRQISALVASDRDARHGTASDEIDFWLAFEAALRSVTTQLEAPLVRQVWEELEAGKRFHATHNFLGDTGLRDSLIRVQGYTQLLFRDIPLGELLSSSSFSALNATVDTVFLHIQKKLRPSGYPSQRSVAFVEALGRDYASILGKLAEAELEEVIDVNMDVTGVLQGIAKLAGEVNDSVETWETQVRDFSTLARELMRKRAERFVVVRVNPAHLGIAMRVRALASLASRHAELASLVHGELDTAFEQVIRTRGLLHLEDADWRHVEAAYVRAAHTAESEFAEMLREQLNAAVGDLEKFAVFAKYAQHDSVLARPLVRAVVHGFQTTLLNRVRADLRSTEVQSRSLPKSIVQRVVRMRQLQMKCNEVRSRLPVVLGSDWMAHSEGQTIAADCDSVLARLNPEGDVESWANSLLHEDGNSSPVLIVNEHDPYGVSVPNISAAAMHAHLELKALRSLGFRFDGNTNHAAEAVADIGTAHARLSDAVASIAAVQRMIRVHPRISVAPQVTSTVNHVLALVRAGLSSVTWMSPELPEFVTALENSSTKLDTRVAQLAVIDYQVTKALEDKELSAEQLKLQVKSAMMDTIQSEYTESVEADLSEVVSAKCATALRDWSPSSVVHRLKLRNQVLLIEPEIEQSVQLWFEELANLTKPVIALDHTVTSAYCAATERLGLAWDAGQNSLNTWLAFQALWDVSVESFTTQLGQDITGWIEALHELRKMRNSAGDKKKLLDNAVIVDSEPARAQIDAKCDHWQDFLVEQLAEHSSVALASLLRSSRKARHDLESSRFVLGALSKALEAIESGADVVKRRDSEILKLKASQEMLTRSRFRFPNDWVSPADVEADIDALKAGLDRRIAEKTLAQPRLLDELNGSERALLADFDQFKARWLATKPVQSAVEPKKALNVLQTAAARCSALHQHATEIDISRRSLNSESATGLSTILKESDAIAADISELEVAWTGIDMCWTQLHTIGDTKFFDIDVVRLKQDMSILQSNIEELPLRTKQLRAFSRVETEFSARYETLGKVSLLRQSEAVKPHHVSELTKVATNEPILEQVWTSLPDYVAVSDVVERAQGEFSLKSYIQGIERKWQDTSLVVTGGVVRNLDPALRLATDNLTALSAMRASLYFSAVVSIVTEWERKLGSVRQAFDKFIDLQSQYVYLSGVLQSPSVSSVLPHESRRFQAVSNEFSEILNNASGRPALDFASEPRIISTLGRLLAQLATLHRALAGFLETQRLRFPRLFFVGDDDLLEIVGSSIDQWGKKHLNSLFPGVDNVVKSNGIITSILSPEGESLPVSLSADTDSIDLLVGLETALHSSLQSSVRAAIKTLPDAWPDPSRFKYWLEAVPVQAALLALRVQYTGHVLEKSEDSNEHYKSLLQLLASAGDNTLLWTRRREAVIAELTHMASHLSPEFPLSEVLTTMDDSKGLQIRFQSFTWDYGYEYLGVPEVLVRTPVTNDLFFASIAAMAQSKGASVIGPAGTGKTESVKALGQIFGHHVAVFNCDESFDFGAVKRVMTGCSATHSWVCFDEFNRLDRDVLSSVAQTVADYVHKTPIFVTMNPGYAGRTVLPPNMRHEFREFILNSPDSSLIAEVLLYAQGLSDPALSEGAVELLETMSQKATSQKHYDWGLRALKRILRVCSLLDGSMKTAVSVTIRPRLVSNDISLFDSEIERIFGSADGMLSNFPDEVENLDVPTHLWQVVRDLDRFSRLYTGVMLFGPPASGKSAAIKELARVRSAESVIMDPSAMSKAALFGKLDPTTREWTDGVLTSLIRRITGNLRGEKDRSWFIVFDGNVEPSWAETMNSVFDDNRQLTLPTGEILPVSSNIHFIFEVADLDAATPATISRCGIICMPPLPSILELSEIPSDALNVAEKISHVMEFSVSRSQVGYTALNLGNKYLSLVWALAGDSNRDGRLAVSNILRSLNSELPKEGSLTDYYVSELTGQWHLWADTVPSTELSSDAVIRPEVVIPTTDTVVHESLLQAALQSHQPLLLVGPPGSGKTMTLFNALRQLPEIGIIPLNFSATTTPDVILQALEMHCEYSVGSDGIRVLSPPGNSWATLFIDEINLPQGNKYHAVSVEQWLRHFLEHGGFYRDTEYVRLERVQLVAACNPPPERRPISPRLLRHMAVVHVGYPSEAALRTIYTAFLNTFGASQLVEPMLAVYAEMRSKLPGENWSPRDLTRWTRSLYTAWNTSSEAQHSSKMLHQLWYDEGMRVLVDKLSIHNKGIAIEVLNRQGLTDTSSPGIWTYLMSHRPQFIELASLREFLSARLAVFVDEAAGEGDGQLVVHDDFVEQVVRVDRVLRQAQGHLLLLGPVATGKTTAVRFSCWLAGIDVVRMRTHSRYDDSDFAQDLRQVLFRSLRRPVCFLVGDDLLRNSAFVERMNSLLANSEVPGLFVTAEENAALEEACRQAGFTGGDLTPWFREHIVANLHVIFVATSLAGASSALLNRCVVNRVDPWSHSVKRQIAAHWCAEIDVQSSVVEALSLTPAINGRAFVETCAQFLSLYRRSKDELEDSQRHLLGGGDKLKEAVLAVAQLKKRLALQQQQLEAEQQKSSDVLSQMLREQSEAERKRVTAVEIRAAVQSQNEQIELRRSKAREDLDAAEPLIAQAAQGVKNIKKSQLNELRAFTNPPEPVKITLEAVVLVLGLKTDGTWRQVLGAVRGDEFIPRIVNFDSRKLAPQIVTQIERDYMTLPSFTFERVDRASKAGGPLLRWVVAQVVYAKALAAVHPLLAEVDRLNIQAEESRARLNAIEGMLSDLEVAIERSKTDYSSAVAQCEVLKADMAHVSGQLERSEALLASLGGERNRWAESAKEFSIKMAMVPGNALIEASMLALSGAMDTSEASKLRRDIEDTLSADGIKISSPREVKPTDIVAESKSVVLVVDPAHIWDPENLPTARRTSFLTDPESLIKEVDTALRFGHHLVIADAERFDPLLYPLLRREYVRKGARLLVNLGGGDIDVSPHFKLTLYARELNGVEKYSPSLLAQVAVVNFTVTAGAFEALVGDALLQAQKPELASRRAELRTINTTTAARLRELEQQLLEIIANPPEGEILNDSVVHSLASLKAEATKLENLRLSTSDTLAELEMAYLEFSPAAVIARKVYLAVKALVDVDPFCVVNVGWLLAIVDQFAHSQIFSRDFTRAVYARVASALRIEYHKRFKTMLQEIIHFDSQDPLTLPSFVLESTPSVPVLAGMASPNTTDPAPWLVQNAPVQCQIIALGSAQAASKAERMLSQALELGEWLVVQNVEIANYEWLSAFSRRSQSAKPDSSFRLIFTGLQSEVLNLPELLAVSRPYNIERDHTIRSSLLSALSPESDRLDFAICWIQACFTQAFPDANFNREDLAAARWFAGIIKDTSSLKVALLTAVYVAKTTSPDTASTMKFFVNGALSDGSPGPNEKYEDWAKQLPKDQNWLPKELLSSQT